MTGDLNQVKLTHLREFQLLLEQGEQSQQQQDREMAQSTAVILRIFKKLREIVLLIKGL